MKKGLLLIVLAAFSLGIVNAQETREGLPGYATTYQANSFWSNWFVSAGVGVNALLAENVKDAKFADIPALMGTVSVGKWFTPWWGARLQFNGGMLNGFPTKNTTKEYTYIGAHADFMLGLLNFFGSSNVERKFDVVPFLGMGAQYETKMERRNLTWNAGIQFKYDINKDLSAWLEGQLTVTDDSYTQFGGLKYDGIGSLALGVSYNFGSFAPKTRPYTVKNYKAIKNSLEERGFASAVPTKDYMNLKNKNKELVDEVTALRNRGPEIREVVREVVNEVTVYKSVPTTIPFLFNSAKIQPIHESLIFNIADFLNKNADAKVRLSGYADKVGGVVVNKKISEKRAKGIAETLVKKYGIDESRIMLEFYGKENPYYEDTTWNRCVVVEVVR